MKFLAFILTFLSLNAFASEVLVSEAMAPFTRNFVEPRFEINRPEGRAWVSVVVYNSRNPNHERQHSSWREKVPGLSFDNATNAIVYNGVVCATVRGSRVTNTGCRFSSKEVTKTRDTGYETYQYQAIQVYLNTL